MNYGLIMMVSLLSTFYTSVATSVTNSFQTWSPVEAHSERLCKTVQLQDFLCSFLFCLGVRSVLRVINGNSL